MPATTSKGVPYPAATDAADVPADLGRLAAWVDARGAGPVEMTNVQRNDLAGVERWVGRVIRNSTTNRLERWDGTAWVGHGIVDALGTTEQRSVQFYDRHLVRTDARSVEMTYDGSGRLSTVRELYEHPTTGARTTVSLTTLTYDDANGGRLATTTEVVPANTFAVPATVERTITTTLTYNAGGNLTGTTRAVV